MEYVKTVARKEGIPVAHNYGDHLDRYKKNYPELECKLEFDWDLFNQHNAGVVNWIEKRPEHHATKSLVFGILRHRIPEELKTSGEIKGFIESHVADIVKKDKNIISISRNNGRTFSVEMSDTEYGRCSYSVSLAYSFDIEIPEEVILEGDGEVRNYIMDNYREIRDPNYGEYEYEDMEATDSEGATIDSVTPDPQDVIDELMEIDGDEEYL